MNTIHVCYKGDHITLDSQTIISLLQITEAYYHSSYASDLYRPAVKEILLKIHPTTSDFWQFEQYRSYKGK